VVGGNSNFDAAIRLEPNDAYAYYNRAEAILNSDFHSQPYTIQQFEQHHHLLIFRHLDSALQNLNRGLQINPHDTDAQNLKTLLIEGLRHGGQIRLTTIRHSEYGDGDHQFFKGVIVVVTILFIVLMYLLGRGKLICLSIISTFWLPARRGGPRSTIVVIAGLCGLAFYLLGYVEDAIPLIL